MTDLESFLVNASALSSQASALAESVQSSEPALAKTVLDITAALRKTLSLLDYGIGRSAEISVLDCHTLNEVRHGVLPEESAYIGAGKMSDAAYRHKDHILRALIGSESFNRRRKSIAAEYASLFSRQCREKPRTSFDTPESDDP